MPTWEAQLRIGLISDTHLTDPETDLDARVYATFAGVDLILHTGDIYATWVLDRLEVVAPVLGVQAYPDPPDPRLQPRRVLELDGLKVALTHNIGSPETPINCDRDLVFPERPHVRDILAKYFGHEDIDVVAFGDTHEELVLTHEGVLFINPGSPTYPGIKHAVNSPGTIAMMEISQGTVEARIIQL